jgi:glutaminyl-tRNA synthetase
MKDGEYANGEHILRAKIDMASPNINMRDPALYRIITDTPHPETGNEWSIYPMYDFSHPISDAVEGITHSLCSLEFEDHRPLYEWALDKLIGKGFIEEERATRGNGNGVPRQIEFSRLNLRYTVLSKRKLIHLVKYNYVNGWSDPRMPTISGVRRRGVPASALKLFNERNGISKTDSNIDVGVFEDCTREVMDKTSPRAFCILNALKVTITNWESEDKLENFEVPRHPKEEDMGLRTVPFGQTLYIEREDLFDVDGPEGERNGGKVPKGFKRLLSGGLVSIVLNSL